MTHISAELVTWTCLALCLRLVHGSIRQHSTQPDVLHIQDKTALSHRPQSVHHRHLLGHSQRTLLGDRNGDRDALVQCINNHQPDLPFASWNASIVERRLSALRVAGAWWSSLPPSGPITLVTSSSLDRMGQLLAQCRAWKGPLSAVVYVPIPVRVDDLAGNEQPDGSAAGISHPDETERLHAIAEELGKLHAQVEEAVAARGSSSAGGSGSSEPLRCQLDLMLTYELYDKRISASFLFPFNVLRNYALLQARTPYVAQLDVDLLPSAGVHRTATADAAASSVDAVAWSRVSKLLNDKRGFVVLPAFRPTEHAASVLLPQSYKLPLPPLPVEKERAVTSYRHDDGLRGGINATLVGLEEGVSRWTLTKQLMADALLGIPKGKAGEGYKQGVLDVFALGHWHGATDFDRWAGLGGSDEPYAIQYELGFEPWGLVKRRGVPMWDARFRGHGFSKVAYMAYVNASGLNLFVHPTEFLLHRHHVKVKAQRQYLKEEERAMKHTKSRHRGEALVASVKEALQQALQAPTFADNFYAHSKHLGATVLAACAAGTYQPVLDPPSLECPKELPWWRKQ